MGRSIREQIEEAFAGLIQDHGLRVLVDSYSPTDFGNAVVILEGEQYSVRVVRDRFQVFVDLASPADPRNWHSLERLIAALDGVDEPSTPFVLEDAVARIRVNHHRFAEYLAPPRYPMMKRELDRLGDAARRRLLNSQQPGR